MLKVSENLQKKTYFEEFLFKQLEQSNLLTVAILEIDPAGNVSRESIKHCFMHKFFIKDFFSKCDQIRKNL